MDLNEKEKALVLELAAKAKAARHADLQVSWRGGQIVDARTTEIVDREKVKGTN